MKAKEFMMMRAFRLFTVKNFAEPENYDRIVSSNIQNVAGKMGLQRESFHINIKLGEIEHQDDILQIIPIKPKQFFLSFANTIAFVHPLNMPNTVVSFSLFLNDEKVFFARRVYSILDLLGDIGGIIGAIEIVFGFLLSSYTE